MHLTAHPHTCNKCGHKQKYSSDNHHPAPAINGFVACPACWESFLRNNVGELILDEPLRSAFADARKRQMQHREQ